jgi:hypothetical protein
MSQQSPKSKAGKAAKPSSSTKSPAGKGRKTTTVKGAPRRSPKPVTGVLRLPAVGEKLTRIYKGKEIIVEATADGFRYGGETYTSLSALAKKITGYPAISGPAFFGLWKRTEAK